ncbi:glycosyltransferase, partial [Vibrio sp. 10N.222.55.E8]
IILVDDSGRNLSFNIPEDFINNLLVINNESNFGIAKSLNLGVHKARQLGYELILTLDDDTRLDLNYVNELKPFLFSSDKVSLVCGVFGGRETEQSPYKSTS